MRTHSQRLRCYRCRVTHVLPLAAALASCTPAPPAAPIASVPPPPPPPPVRVVRPLLHAAWSFQAAAGVCLATARAGSASLNLAIHPSGPIRLVLSLPRAIPDHTLARFSGPAGTWDIRAAASPHHTAIFLLPRSELSLGRILVLLSGGQLVPAPADLPILVLPESGAAGQHWFDCARQSVSGA